MDSVGSTVIGQVNNKPKNKANSKVIGAIVGVVVLVLGVVAGILLVRQQQNIAEKAAVTCVEQCPGPGGVVLRNCHPPAPDGSSDDSRCNSSFVNRIAFCGVSCFKCNGAIWTVTDLSACSTPSPTASPVVTASPTPTITPVASPTMPANPTKSCKALKIYTDDSSSTLLTATQLANLKAGSKIKLCASGLTNAPISLGSFTTAQIAVNGTNLPITTSGSQKTEGFCNSYTIPTTPKTFNITARVFHSTLGWTTNNSACNRSFTLGVVATASPTATSVATATATSASTSSSNATSTPNNNNSSPTPVPLPVTGVEWPTVLGGGLGIIMILASLTLAL